VGGKNFAYGRQKIGFFQMLISGHRQDIQVLLMVLNFAFAQVSWRK
jgi:hypothetical protein